MDSSAPARRIGSQDSKTRALLLDAAEALVVEEGYAAVTSRRVAAKAGLKPQLVHYYFRTMDDLYIEVLRRAADENLTRFERAVSEDVSLADLWRLNADQRAVTFTMEFAALANHRKSIRAELARYAERFRGAQLGAMRAALARLGIAEDQLPADAALLLLTGLTQVLALERALGVTSGHATTIEFVRRTIEQLDNQAAQPGTSPRGSGRGRSV